MDELSITMKAREFLIKCGPSALPVLVERYAAEIGGLSTAAQKCARWRRKGVPVWLREKGLESLACLFVAARIEALGV